MNIAFIIIARRVYIFSALLLLSACASTYRAPDLPIGGDSAIAILEPAIFDRGAKFFITKIDGKFRGVGWFNRFELVPGRREITAGLNPHDFKGSEITRFFTAEAGKKYLFVVKDDPVAMRWSFSILESATGRRVDSVTP